MITKQTNLAIDLTRFSFNNASIQASSAHSDLATHSLVLVFPSMMRYFRFIREIEDCNEFTFEGDCTTQKPTLTISIP